MILFFQPANDMVQSKLIGATLDPSWNKNIIVRQDIQNCITRKKNSLQETTFYTPNHRLAKNFNAGGVVEFQRILNQRCQQSKKQLIQLLPEKWQCWKVLLSPPVSPSSDLGGRGGGQLVYPTWMLYFLQSRSSKRSSHPRARSKVNSSPQFSPFAMWCGFSF